MSERLYLEDKTFENVSYASGFETGTYENCYFKNCDLSKKNLSDSSFIDCSFQICDLSNVSLNNTGLRGVSFVECKLIGVNFDSVNDMLLKFNFENCQMNLASFYTKSIKETIFKDCILVEADFAEADLTKAAFINCDLDSAIFDRTNLSHADFQSARNYRINPEENNVFKARFSEQGLRGLLSNLNIIITD